MVPTHSFAMGTSAGSILMTLTGMGGGVAVLADTSFLPQPDNRLVPIDNSARPTSIERIRAPSAFLCLFTFMLALRLGEVGVSSRSCGRSKCLARNCSTWMKLILFRIHESRLNANFERPQFHRIA